MTQKTMIQEDKYGLYVIADGHYGRPFAGTGFKKGEKVKTHHFSGSMDIGVTFEKYNFRNYDNCEIWITCGLDWGKDSTDPQGSEAAYEKSNSYSKQQAHPALFFHNEDIGIKLHGVPSP